MWLVLMWLDVSSWGVECLVCLLLEYYSWGVSLWDYE